MRARPFAMAYGALLGGGVGTVAGAVEFLLLYRDRAFTGEVARFSLEIVVPYGLVGVVGGLAVGGLVAGLRRRPAPPGEVLARLIVVIPAAAALAYLVVLATYFLGPPLTKPLNLLAYAGATALVGGFSAVLVRALSGLVSRRAEARLRAPQRWLALVLVAAIAGLLGPALYRVGAPAHAVPSTAPPAGERPTIVFILIDALRADHLPTYGYSRPTAPGLAALAERSTVFTRAYAATSWTQPSIATMFSSLYPQFHGVVEHGDVVPASVPVLPETLRAAGYRTFGVSANPFVSPTFGYTRGFDHFWVSKTLSAFHLTAMGEVVAGLVSPRRLKELLGDRHSIAPSADVITDLTLEWAARNREATLFLYVHYIDPHAPYRPPGPYDRTFDHRRDPPARRGQARPLDLIPNETERARLGRALDFYDGEILYADTHVARLLRGLEALGVMRNAITLVTADHGEEFGEHGREGHRETLYEGALRVPLFVAWPGRIPGGRRIDEPVGLIDLMPTLLGLVGIAPPPGVQGADLSAHLRGGPAPAGERRLFAHLRRISYALEMVRDRRYKLIRHVAGPEAGREELYDTTHDPGERRDLAGRWPGVAATLRRDLETFNALVAAAGSGSRPERVHKVDRDTERALRSLGYIK